jgi:hypothetical protein
VHGAIRALELKVARPIGILQDLQGPKIRVGTIRDGKFAVAAGEQVRLVVSGSDGDKMSIPLPHPEIFEAVSPGDASFNASQMQEKGDSLRMSDAQIDFSAPATLRKWPSVNKERVSASLGARPYLIIEGTLHECIQNFMLKPISQHHLYEIHTVPQSDLVGAILSADHVIELARLRDFLGE